MSNEFEALMRTVCEYPFDDTPRLVVADWLEENNQVDTAHYIRHSINKFHAFGEKQFIDELGTRESCRMFLDDLRLTSVFDAVDWNKRLSRTFYTGYTIGVIDRRNLIRGFIGRVTINNLKIWVEYSYGCVRVWPVVSVHTRTQPHRLDSDAALMYLPLGVKKKFYYVFCPHSKKHSLSLIHRIPDAIYDLMGGYANLDSEHIKAYETEDAANASLNLACLMYARNKVYGK